ncbi:MAG: GNAT family N-acetyltransferase [Synergistaceae bacterium]|jgi:ribosomal protein S18 acetylase RimI-like enzyme|nr:GNAT family N-acetyltransferase [Synergistaceae bacterium]
MPFKIIHAEKKHILKDFCCGTPELDKYLKQYAGQDLRRNLATLFVAVEDGEDKVLGYYTLSNTGVSTQIIPSSLRKKLPMYDDVPAIRIGRLAVDQSVQGQGLGARLLANAVIMSISTVSAWALMVVDAKDEAACAFYGKFGFEALEDDEKHLFATRKNLEALFLVKSE